MSDIAELVKKLRSGANEWGLKHQLPHICEKFVEAADALEQLQTEQRKDLADVERFRGMARTYMDERDALRAKVERYEKELKSIAEFYPPFGYLDEYPECEVLVNSAREALAEGL